MTTDEIKRIAASVYEAQAVEAEARRTTANLRGGLRKALGEHLGIKPDDVDLGGWDCPSSPTGQCVYNSREDPALDDCVFCGGPDERK